MSEVDIDLAIYSLKLAPLSIVSLGYNKSLKVFLKITPSALEALGRRFESCRPDQLYQ